MGKYKGNKPKIRTNPVGLPSMKEILLDENERLDGTGDGNYVGNLIDQLKSHVAEERDSGLNSLSVSCQNPKLLEELLEADIVKIAGSLLLDSSAMVRHSAAGALRNMSMIGPSVCDFMVSQDVVTPLVTLVKQKYSVDWQPGKKKDGKIDTLTETFIQAVNLLWNLCENNDTVVKTFNREGLAEIIPKFLNIETYGVGVALPIAQLFHAVTEDNPDLVPNIEQLESTFERVVTAADQDGIQWKYLQTLAVGVLLNLKQGQLSKVSPAHLSTYVQILVYALNINHLEEIRKITERQSFANGKEQNGSSNGVDHKGPETSNGDEAGMEVTGIATLEEELEDVINVLSAQILSLTIFSNLVCVDDDVDDDSESEESVTDFNGDIEDATMETDDGWSSVVPPEVHEIIVTQDLRGKLVDKVQQLDKDTFNILSKNESGLKIFRLLTQLRSTALLCFQNLVGCLEITDLGGLEQTESIFSASISVLFEEASGEPPQFGNANLIEGITSLQRAIMQKWTQDNFTKPIGWFSADNLNVFCQVYQMIRVGKIRANIIKIIGGYGVLLAKTEVTSEESVTVKLLLAQVGEFLLRCVCDPFDKDQLPVAAEALDTIFDVFAEDDHNDVLKKLDMIEKLKKFSPNYKRFIQNQRRELGEHRAIIQTSKANLSRFIQYKLQHGCS